MASRLVPDFPAVPVALEHVKELDKELKDEGVAFSPEASAHLAEIARAVTVLEAERRAAHEHLEVATIENSKLRHDMNHARDQMSHVIVTDVAAARASNAEEIEQLRGELHDVSRMQETAAKKHEAVEFEIESLTVERETVKDEHQEDVAALTDEITQKYALQSQLDQTRENMDEIQASIELYEHSALTLQRDLASEKETFVKCRNDLSKELEENEERIKHHNGEILRSRRELELLNESTRDDSDSLDHLRFQNVQLESSIQQLQASKSQCEKIVETQKGKCIQLAAQKEALQKQLDEMIKAFSEALAAIKEEIVVLEQRTVAARETKACLRDAFAKVHEVFKVHDEEETEVRAEYDYVSELLAKSRRQLEERIASIVRHKKEMKEMEKQTEELKETDLINKRVFQRDEEELRGNIDVQKQHMHVLEEEIKQLQKDLKEEMRTQEGYVKKITANIKVTWKRVKDLQTEEATLQQKRTMTPDQIEQYIEQCKAEYKQMESLCREEIKQFSNEIEIVAKKCEEKQKEVAEKKQILEDVEVEWKEEASRFEQLKKQEVDFKRRKCDLVESVEVVRNESVKLLEPIDEKKAELERIRVEHIDRLRNQTMEMKSVEMLIYDCSVKLEQVEMENSRLRLSIKRMTEDLNKAKDDKERYMAEAGWLQKNSMMMFRRLQEAWSEELSLTQERHRVDAALVLPIRALQSHIRTRGRRLGHVQVLLHEHMLDFSRRLGDKITVEPQS